MRFFDGMQVSTAFGTTDLMNKVIILKILAKELRLSHNNDSKFIIFNQIL